MSEPKGEISTELANKLIDIPDQELEKMDGIASEALDAAIGIFNTANNAIIRLEKELKKIGADEEKLKKEIAEWQQVKKDAETIYSDRIGPLIDILREKKRRQKEKQSENGT